MSTTVPSTLSIPFAPPSELGRIAPEPKSRVGFSFGNVLKDAASNLLDAGAAAVGVDGDYGALLSMQIQAQREMQVVSMASNVEKSKHETQMAAIRNIRVG